MSELDKVCCLLDKLTLDALTLIEENVQVKLNVEASMAGGEDHLARSRYILGHNSVSALQLPAENSREFDATAVVNKSEDQEFFQQTGRDLEFIKKEEQNDPVRWFGYFVPQDLYHAQKMFKQALHWIVKGANVQTKLMETCEKIEQLKDVKEGLKLVK